MVSLNHLEFAKLQPQSTRNKRVASANCHATLPVMISSYSTETTRLICGSTKHGAKNNGFLFKVFPVWWKWFRTRNMWCHSDVLFDLWYYTPRKLTWNLKVTPLKRNIIFQTFILGSKCINLLVFGGVILPPWHFCNHCLRGASCRRAIGTADERTHLSSFCQEEPGWDGESVNDSGVGVGGCWLDWAVPSDEHSNEQPGWPFFLLWKCRANGRNKVRGGSNIIRGWDWLHQLANQQTTQLGKQPNH